MGAASVATFLVAWQVVASGNLVGPDLISSPREVLLVGASMVASGELTGHVLVSVQELFYGFAPAVVVGVVLGLLMGSFRRLRWLLDPLVMALYTVPRIALIPVLVLWFGVGMGSKVAVAFLGGLFPVVVNTMVGVQQIDPVWIRAVRSLGANTIQVAATVTLPGACLAVLAGIRLGLGRAIIGVVVGEMYVSVAGVGQLIQVYGSAGRAAELMAVATFIAGFGFLGARALGWLEGRMGRKPGGLER